MIDHHRHQELNMLLHCEILFCFEIRCVATWIFKYACQFGCVKCVKTILDRSEEKGIDLNLVKKWKTRYYEPHEYKYEHCLHVAYQNVHKKEVLDMLLRSAKEKGIDIHAKMNDRFGQTEPLRDAIIMAYFRGDLDKEGH